MAPSWHFFSQVRHQSLFLLAKMGALVVTHHSSLIQLQTATKRSSPEHLHPSGFRFLLFSSHWTKCLCRYWVRLAISPGQVNPVSVGWITEVCWLPLCSLEIQHHPTELVGPWLVVWEWGESLRGTELPWLLCGVLGGALPMLSTHCWRANISQYPLVITKASSKVPAVSEGQQERAGAVSSTYPGQSLCRSMGPEPQRWLEIVLPMLTPVPSPSGWGGPRTEA